MSEGLIAYIRCQFSGRSSSYLSSIFWVWEIALHGIKIW